MGARRGGQRHSAEAAAGYRRAATSTCIRSTGSITSARRPATEPSVAGARSTLQATQSLTRTYNARCPRKASGAPPSLPMPLYATTIFCSAFLLFSCSRSWPSRSCRGSADRPMYGRPVLFSFSRPAAGLRLLRSGGAPAHARAQLRLHLALLALSCRAADRSRRALEAAGRRESGAVILGLLALTVGLPYFLLSTTSPLVQSWFARRFPGRSPYRLFALSNLASMLALAGYPFALEPWVTTRMQSYGWSAAYPCSYCCAPHARGTACGLCHQPM